MNWINKFNRATFNNWKCYTDPCNGVLTWYFITSEFSVMATPNWDGINKTPIEYYSNYHDFLKLGELKQFKFKTFKEYAKTIEPFLEYAFVIYLTSTLNQFDIVE